MKMKKISEMKNVPVDGAQGYSRLLTEISGIIVQGRKAALRQIDVTQVITYWLVGRRIVEFYQFGKSRAD